MNLYLYIYAVSKFLAKTYKSKYLFIFISIIYIFFCKMTSMYKKQKKILIQVLCEFKN
jgi:hypothetical protein